MVLQLEDEHLDKKEIGIFAKKDLDIQFQYGLSPIDS